MDEEHDSTRARCAPASTAASSTSTPRRSISPRASCSRTPRRRRARFANEEPGNVYSRFTNPTVTSFQERLAALEGAEVCIATASGMSAILATSWACSRRATTSSPRPACSARPCSSSATSWRSSASTRRSSTAPIRRSVAARGAAGNAAPVPRDAVQPADRDRRHRRARGDREEGRRARSRSTTASARPRCSSRSSSARTW